MARIPDVPGALRSAEAAGARLRREARRRRTLRVLVGLAVSVAVATGLVAARALLQPEAPAPRWAHPFLAVLLWSAVVWLAQRAFRTDVRDAGELRAGTVCEGTCGQTLVVRESSGVVLRWRRRHQPGVRTPRPGERCWLTGGGRIERPPHLVLAVPAAPGRHVLWSVPEAGLVRLPDPPSEHHIDGRYVVDADERIS